MESLLSTFNTDAAGTYSNVEKHLKCSVFLPLVFEDKAFMEEDLPYAVRLFEDTPPFLLSQILGLRMDQWLAIEEADKEDMERQQVGVLQSWGRSGDSAKWSALVEALIIVGLRGKAQTACLNKGEHSFIRSLSLKQARGAS